MRYSFFGILPNSNAIILLEGDTLSVFLNEQKVKMLCALTLSGKVKLAQIQRSKPEILVERFCLYDEYSIGQLLVDLKQMKCIRIGSYSQRQIIQDILFFDELTLMLTTDGQLSLLKNQGYQILKRINFVSKKISASISIGETLDYFVGSDDGSIQNIQFRSLHLSKNVNQIYYYHNKRIVDICVRSNPMVTKASYIISLDSNSIVAVWNTQRSQIGPLYTLRFDEEIIRIVELTLILDGCARALSSRHKRVLLTS